MMWESWLDQLDQRLHCRVVVAQAPLATALQSIGTVLPTLELVEDTTNSPTLRWSPGSMRPSTAIGEAFWEFLTLSEAPDEEVIRFAQRYGPLSWPGDVRGGTRSHRGSAPIDRTRDASLPDDRFDEPLAAWRTCSRGLSRLYDLLDPALPSSAREAFTPFTIAHTAVLLFLPEVALTYTEEEIGKQMVLNGLKHGPTFVYVSPEQLLNEVLAASQVGPAYPFVFEKPSEIAFSIPGAPAERSTRNGQVSWQVRGLLPVLSVSLAFAILNEERPRCTWCGKPAAIVKRKPRAGQPWYGDHKDCRTWARVDTKLRSEDKRAKQRRSRSGSPSESPTDPEA